MRLGARSLLSICVLQLAFAGRTPAQTPTVTGISPTSGPVGVSVAISGTSFGATQGASTVSLNGVSAAVASWSDTNIIAIVPANATSGSFSVTVGGQVANSSSFTTTPLPSVWSDADVGSPGVAGSGAYSNGTYTIVGGGRQISTTDAMHFTYQPLSGDGSMVARMATFQGSSAPIAGVMIRETLAANASNVYLQFAPSFAPNQAVSVSDRPSTGGSTSDSNYFTVALPYWLKLTRSGSTFTGYTSTNGVSWAQAAPSVTISMAQNAYVGLSVYGGSSTVSATATFDNVAVISATSPVITTISATTGPTGSNVVISGSNFGVSQSSSLVWLGATAVTITFWSNTAIAAIIPSGAASGRLFVSLSPSLNTSNFFYFTITSNPVPSGWLDQDIGVMSVTGAATYSNGTFTVSGAGVNTYTAADALHFAYMPLAGDGSIVARIVSYSGTANMGRVTVMIRETLSPGALDAHVSFYPNQSYFYYRTTANTSPSYQNGSFTASGPPYWLKLVRTGSTFTGYMSSDGLNWAQAGSSETVNMAQDAYIGLGVDSGSASSASTATFDNVEVSSAVTPVPTITGVSATSGSIGNQIVISGAHFGASQGNSFVTLNNVAMTINQWSDASIVATISAGATSGHLFVTVAASMDDSNYVNFTVTTNPLPPGWLDQDIGTVGLVGNATYANGVFTVAGAGQSYTNAAPDHFHFAYLPLSGDGSIVARLTGYTGSSNGAPALMIRETLDPGSRDAFTQYIPNQIYISDRPNPNASVTTSSGVGFAASYPYWLKLTRSGNTFTVYISSDGVNWVQGSSATVTMAQNVYAGLASESGSTTSLTFFSFDNVSVSSASAPAPIITNLSATTGAVGSQVVISGSNFGGTQGSSSLVMLNGVPVTISSWSATSITVTIPVGASSGPVVVALGPSLIESNYVTFTVTTNPLPSGWLDQDIGSPGITGRASYTSGTFTVSGGGTVGNSADAFHFAYQSLSGDGTIVARLVNLSGTGMTQSGVMIRETLAANSTFALIYYYPPYISAYFSDRASTGGAASLSANVTISLPSWLKVTRSGNTFAAYASTDGVYWTQVGSSVSITMAQSVYIGLAEAGNSTTTIGTAAFDNVTITAGTPPLNPLITGITPTFGSVGTSVTISGSNFGGTQGTSSVRFNGAAATTITSWTSGQIIAAVPSNASTGPVTVIVNGIGSNKNYSLSFYNPVISSIAPPAAPTLGVVTLTGSGFGVVQGGSQVTFNGISAGISSWSDTSVSAGVPGTGPVTVTVGGITSNSVQFTLVEATTITGLAPAIGSVGTTVTITGTGFGASQSNSVANFYLAPANIVNWSDTQIVTTVPLGAATGNITVTVAGKTAQGPVFSLTSGATLTDSLGNTTTYNAQLTGGWWHPSTWQGSGCSSCTLRGTKQDTFDSNGNILTETDELSRTKTYTYDSNNNVLSVSQPDGNGNTIKTSFTYNGFNEVLTSTDPLGNVTTNTYDAYGNLLTVTTPKPNSSTAASVTQFTYNSLGQLTQIKDPLNNVTTLTYTSVGLIFTIKDAQNNVTTYGYDTHGNRTSVTDALTHQTTFAYDTGDRLTTITYPDTTTTSFGYDTRGRRISVTDQNGKTTAYAYDDADRLTTVTDAASHVTTYGYDTENNLTSIKDANNNTTSFTPDAFGRVTQTTFPSGYVESYSYDAVGNLTGKTDRKNQAIAYTYDQLNRLTQKSYPDTTTVNYTYDLDSRLTQVIDPTGTYQFTFDNMGRLTAASTSYTFLTARNFITGYSYDAASNRTGFTDPESGSTTYFYDTLNRLQTLTPPSAFSGSGSFGFGYDVLSRRTQMTRPNNVTTNYGYDNLSRLQSVLHQLAGSTIDGATYTVDNAGNRTARTDQRAGVTSNYGYDAIYELTGVTQGTNTTESYTYDPVGNRLSSLGVSPYSVNASNQLTSTPNTIYSYDSNGNTLTKVVGSNTTGYAWDFENRMSSVTLPGSGGTVSFRYDPFGRRIYKSSSSATSVYAYDGDNLVEETNAVGAIVARYSQTQNIDEPLAMLRSAATSYYHADGLGSVTSLSNAAGSIANTYTYDSFGKLTASTGSLTNPFQYTARESDTETGLYYYRVRYYDPGAGRFLSEDPIGFNSDQNDFYAYVANRPTMNVDPFGLAHCWFSLNGLGSTGLFVCIPDKPGDPIVRFPANSGNNGDSAQSCQNNSHCPPNDHGPLPLGPYNFGGPSGTHGSIGGIHLIPTGKDNQYGRDGRFLTHWCINALDSQTSPGSKGRFCSEGCIVSTPDNIKALNGLLANEPGSTLFVSE